jgi:hypothetical protein
MSSNKQNIHPYVIIGSLTALGGVALGITGSWIFSKFLKNKHDVNCSTTQHTQIQSQGELTTTTRTDGVYIQQEDGDTKFLTNEEFQRYFEYNINKDEGIELDWCLLEYALKLDPMNIRFFKNEQKTLAFEKLVVEQYIETLVYCRSEEDIFDLQTTTELPNNSITYRKYEIHDYAYELYGNEIYRFIDHPTGYSYEELMSMPPPEFKDMTVSEVFHTIQQVEEVPSKEDIINSIIEENTPAILKIEFTADLTSDEEDEEQEDQKDQEE